MSDDGTSEGTGGTTEVFELHSGRNKHGGPTPLLCTLAFDCVIRQRWISLALYCVRESVWIMGYAVTLWEGHDHQ